MRPVTLPPERPSHFGARVVPRPALGSRAPDLGSIQVSRTRVLGRHWPSPLLELPPILHHPPHPRTDRVPQHPRARSLGPFPGRSDPPGYGWCGEGFAAGRKAHRVRGLGTCVGGHRGALGGDGPSCVDLPVSQPGQLGRLGNSVVALCVLAQRATLLACGSDPGRCRREGDGANRRFSRARNRVYNGRMFTEGVDLGGRM